MKIIVSSVTFWVVLAVLILTLGCEEQELNSRRIRLVADENLKLKEQLKICNQQIGKLEEVIDKYEQKEQKWANTEKGMGDSVIRLLKENDALKKEIEKHSDENQQLKAKLAERGGQPDSQ